jgi:hypothetical protein
MNLDKADFPKMDMFFGQGHSSYCERIKGSVQNSGPA